MIMSSFKNIIIILLLCMNNTSLATFPSFKLNQIVNENICYDDVDLVLTQVQPVSLKTKWDMDFFGMEILPCNICNKIYFFLNS